MSEDDGDKLHEPSQKKLDDAREKGQFAKSKEFNALVVLFFGYGGMLALGPAKAITTKEYAIQMFQWTMDTNADPVLAMRHAFAMSTEHLWEFLGIPLTFLWIVVVFFSIALNRFVIPKESLKFDLQKINPISNFKEKFLSFQPIVELFKSLLKLFLLGYVVWRIIRLEWPELPALIFADPSSVLHHLRDLVADIFWGCIPLISAIAVMDFGYQWYENRKKMMMTHQELKEEQKNMLGNPEIKQRQKQRSREILMSAIAKNVPKADVVVVNPTHYAVALRYNPEEAQAPFVVAKGVDYLALRIRILADQYDIPIVENPVLARGLYAQTKEGQMIPEDFYATVAQILSMIYARRGLKMG